MNFGMRSRCLKHKYQKSPEHKILKSSKVLLQNPEAVTNTTRHTEENSKETGNNGEGEREPENHEEQQIMIGNSSMGGEIWNVEEACKKPRNIIR